jgi:hypothetical protein
MTTETKFRVGLVMSLLGLVIMTFEYFEKDRVYQELKVSSSKQFDSLEMMYFNDAGKYEMALEIYKEINPKAVDEIELIKIQSE